MAVRGDRRQHEPNYGTVWACIEGTAPSGGWIRRQSRSDIERRRVERTLRDNFFFHISTEKCEEHFGFGTGEKGNRPEGSGNQSTFEGADRAG